MKRKTKPKGKNKNSQKVEVKSGLYWDRFEDDEKHYVSSPMSNEGCCMVPQRSHKGR